MRLFQILIYILLFSMLFRMFNMKKNNGNLSKFIELVKLVNDEEAFLTKSQEEIEASQTEEERTKFQVLRLWGIAQHKRYDELDFDGLMQEIELKHLYEANKMNNDDTLFYYFLAIPNILYHDQMPERIDALFSRLEDQLDSFESRLDYNIGKACKQYFEGNQETAVAFFEKVMEGDYGEFSYAKQLIGLYKETVAIMLLKYYQDQNNEEKFKEYEALGAEYYTTRIGGNMISNIGLVIPGVTNVGVTAVDSEETADIIDAEVEEHEEEKEEKEISVEEESETGTSFTGSGDSEE